jgi:hypothetical protein
MKTPGNLVLSFGRLVTFFRRGKMLGHIVGRPKTPDRGIEQQYLMNDGRVVCKEQSNPYAA